VGSCNYYLRASFDSREKAESAVKVLKDMLRQNIEAYDFWQTNRCSKTMTSAQFWEEFTTKFPLVCEVLQLVKETAYHKNPIGGMDINNSLSGILGFIAAEEDIDNVKVVKKDDEYEIQYFAEVWHFNSWEHLSDWMNSKIGAKESRWTSDELLEESSFPDF
jgi:hypothetical protein